MMRLFQLPLRVRESPRPFSNEKAAQIVEFALSLPLLMVFVIGIFDFSGALSLKQKLTYAARDGARVAAADPANDLTAVVPASVSDAFQAVDLDLVSANVNDCGLGKFPPTGSTGLTWTASHTGFGCPGSGVTLTINRGCTTPQTTGKTTINLVNTCVTLTYAYNWRFNAVSGLVGGAFTGPTTITTTAVAFNEN
jgi:Flp pilus assembly protein TadG